ncbi:MAG: hypothetical protein ABSF33_01565 [Acidimicrobiales bacterium]
MTDSRSIRNWWLAPVGGSTTPEYSLVIQAGPSEPSSLLADRGCGDLAGLRGR